MTVRGKPDHLSRKLLAQGSIFILRIEEQNVIRGMQIDICRFPLAAKGFTGTGSTKNQTVWILQFFSVYHNQVVGERIEAIVQSLISRLKQLLGRKRNENRSRAGGQGPLNLNQVACKRKAAHKSLLLLEIKSSQIAVVLLCDRSSLEHVIFQLLLVFSGIHDEKGDQKHSLVLRLKLLQECLCVLTIGGKVRRNDVHVIAGTHRLFLLLDLASIQLGDCVLDLLDGCRLVNGLDVHGHDLTGLHIQEVLQKLVGKVRCCDLQITHGSTEISHSEGPASREREGSGCNKILYRKAGACKPVPIKIEAIMIAHVEHGMHQLQTFSAVQHSGDNAKTLEIIHHVCLHMIQTRLGLLHGIRLNTEADIFRLCQTIIALGELHFQHLTVLTADIVEVVIAIGNADLFLKAFRIGCHVHERQLKVDGAVEIVQEGTPLFKDCGLVLLLCQLIVDVLILDGLGVIIIRHTANAIREHTLERYRLLCAAGNSIITLRTFDYCLYLPCLSLTQIFRHVQTSFFCFVEQTFHRKQYDLPPFLPVPDGSGRHSSYSSDKDEPSALRTWPE